MKYLVYLALGLILHSAAAEPIEVTGLLSSSEDHALVVLTDKADAGVSPWLSEGKIWRGYKVVSIVVADDSVTLLKDGLSTTLRLRNSKVRAGHSAGAGDIRLLTGRVTTVGYRITYSPDAVVQAGPYKIRARSGRMESEGAWVVGDLTVEAENGSKLSAASVGANGARVRISANKVSLPAPPPIFESKKR